MACTTLCLDHQNLKTMYVNWTFVHVDTYEHFKGVVWCLHAIYDVILLYYGILMQWSKAEHFQKSFAHVKD